MEVGGSESITLAFSLTALEKLATPREVLQSARKWTTNIGVLSSENTLNITNFSYDHRLNFDFTSGSRTLEDSLEESQQMLATTRHIFVGTLEQQKELAEKQDWEYLSIEEAAGAADWELTSRSDDIQYDGDLLEIQEKAENDAHIEIPVNTLRWHQINRGEKEWIIRAVDEEINTETLYDDRVALLKRGVGDGHQLWAVITDVRTFETTEEVIDDIQYDLIRPHADKEGVAGRISETIGNTEKYIAAHLKTINPEENEELAEALTE